MLTTNTNLPTETKNQLNEHVIHLFEVESVSTFARRINKEAFDIAELAEFRRKIGLDQRARVQDQPMNSRAEIVMLGIDDMEYLHSMNVPASNLTVRNFCTSDNRTMVYGDSNVGKSFFMQNIALGCATGTQSFFLTAAPASKIAYLDGELGESFFPRLRQIYDGNSSQYIKENLKVIPLRGISLVNQATQEQVLNKLKIFNPNIVIIDNLIALLPEAVKGNINCLLSFVYNVEHTGAAVIIVHHTEKNAKTYKGSIELAALCQNVIHLEGRDQIKERFKKDGLEMPLSLSCAIEAPQNGPVIAMIVEKCKVCPELERQPHYYYLPINGKWQRIGMDELVDEEGEELTSEPTSVEDHMATANSLDADENTRNQQDKAIKLPPDERNLFEFMQRHPGGVKRTEIDEALGWRENKSRDVLNSLIEKDIAARQNEGKKRFYMLTPDAKNIICSSSDLI